MMLDLDFFKVQYKLLKTKHCIVNRSSLLCCRSGFSLELPAIFDHAEPLLQWEASSGQWTVGSRKPCGTLLPVTTGPVPPVSVWMEGGLPHPGWHSTQLLCVCGPDEASGRPQEPPGQRRGAGPGGGSSVCREEEAQRQTTGFLCLQRPWFCHLHCRRHPSWCWGCLYLQCLLWVMLRSWGNEDTKSALLLTILGFVDMFARPTCGVIAGLKWVRPRCIYLFSFAMLFNGVTDLVGSQVWFFTSWKENVLPTDVNSKHIYSSLTISRLFPGQWLSNSGGLLHLFWPFLWHGGGPAVWSPHDNSWHWEVLQCHWPGAAHGGCCRAAGATWCRSVSTRTITCTHHRLYINYV